MPKDENESIFGMALPETTKHTRESILNDFFNAERLHLKTEVDDAYAMTAFDMVGLYFQPEDATLVKKQGLENFNMNKASPGDIILASGERLRTNMISSGRLSRREVLEGVKATTGEEDTKLGMIKRMFGSSLV